MMASIRFNTDARLRIMSLMSVVHHPHADAGHQKERNQEDCCQQLANRLASVLVFFNEEFEF